MLSVDNGNAGLRNKFISIFVLYCRQLAINADIK